MKPTYIASLVLFALPAISHAQTLHDFFTNIRIFTTNVIIPFLIGIAFLFFVINVIRFFVFGSTNEQGRENAKALAIYGITAFVLIVVFWGIINLVSSSIGLDGKAQPKPDYIEEMGG